MKTYPAALTQKQCARMLRRAFHQRPQKIAGAFLAADLEKPRGKLCKKIPHRPG